VNRVRNVQFYSVDVSVPLFQAIVLDTRKALAVRRKLTRMSCFLSENPIERGLYTTIQRSRLYGKAKHTVDV
jgi:hypothetical protein